MRVRWVLMAGGVAGLLLLGAVYAKTEGYGVRGAKAQIIVLEQHIEGESLVVSVLASNTGSKVLVNGGNLDVRYEKDGSWNTNWLPGHRSLIKWMLPEETNRERLILPPGVRRFQVGAGYEAAHGKEAALCRLYSSRLPIWLRDAMVKIVDLMPYSPGPHVQFWDVEHEVQTGEGGSLGK